MVRTVAGIHEQGWAHLDIRLKNIVFNTTNSWWTLIDSEYAQKHGSPITADQLPRVAKEDPRYKRRSQSGVWPDGDGDLRLLDLFALGALVSGVSGVQGETQLFITDVGVVDQAKKLQDDSAAVRQAAMAALLQSAGVYNFKEIL